MGISDDEYVFAWPSAIIRAEEELTLDQVAECLRNENIDFTMHERRMLAELLVPLRKSSKVQAVMEGRAGRGGTVVRDLRFYRAVQAYKFDRKLKRMKEEELKKIGEEFLLRSKDARYSALRRGKAIADAVDAANDE